MSQYLSFKLINKENPAVKVDLGYWCTSIARSISYNFNGIFRYTESDIKLSIETLKSYIEDLHNGIEEYRKNLLESQEKKKEFVELLLKAQTEAAVNAIKEEIYCNDDCIADWKEEIEDWVMVEDKLNFILNVLDDNKDNWELVYKNS